MSVRALSPALAEKARVELNEDPNRLQDDLQSIKDWIAKQPHLNARTDDQWLLAFLRGSKFSLEVTKEKIDNYYTLRSTAPEMFRLKHTDPLFEEILSLGHILILPMTEGPDSPRISLVRPGRFDPSKYHIGDLASVTNTLMKIILMEDDHATVAGTINITDSEGVVMGHILQMTPVTVKKIIATSQESLPIRMKAGHYVNSMAGVQTLFNVMRTFLNEKTRSRLHVHKDYEVMFNFIPKDVFPDECGGNGGNSEDIIDYWRNKVKEYDSWLTEDWQYGTDESKRPGKPRTEEDMFGLEGSFRQLQFD